MTDWERINYWTKKFNTLCSGREYDENGIDPSVLRANLRLTPSQRLEKHNRAALFVRVMMQVDQDRELTRVKR